MKDIKVLIVEDDANSAFILKTILLKNGFKIAATATSGEEALAAIQAHKTDIILMDIDIHGELDGIETAHQILESKGTPIIYLTGASDKKTIERAKKTEPFGYILKPYSEQEIAISIEMALYKATMNAKLKASEEHLNTILQSLHDGIISTDSQGQVTYINPAAQRITGYSNKQAQNRPLDSILPLYNNPVQKNAYSIEQLLANPEDAAWAHQPFSYTSPSGQHYYLHIQASLVKNKNEQPNCYSIAIQDVTQRYESDKHIRMMAAALESIDDAVIITLTQAEKGFPKIIYANRGFERITLYSKAEALDKPLDLLMQDISDPTFNNLLHNALEAGCPSTEETILYRKDKKDFNALCSAAAVYTSEGEISHLVFIIRDISKLKRIEENLRQSQKIESIGRLAGGIAHDFNNLLSVINSYSDILLLKLSSSPLINYVENIRTAGNKGASLISQLMAFSRQQALKPEIMDLKRVATETQEMLSRVIWEETEIKTIFDDNIYPVNIGKGQIEQILINLCVNARDAMPNGGTITLHLRNCSISEQTSKSPNPKIPGEYVLLCVSDTGIGMDKETAKRIFEPFFTTKEIGKGTGLGLSTVYGIIKQIGGHIEVESELGKGTCFKLYFPAATNTGAIQSISPKAKQGILFIIDADESFSDCISGLLSLHGYKTRSALNIEQALEQFYIKKEGPKLFIISADLFQCIGPQEKKRLFGQNKENNIIIIADEHSKEPPPFEGTNPIILKKPFPLQTILDTVKALFQESTFIPVAPQQ